MQQYTEKKKRKGSGSTIAEPKLKKHNLFTVLEKLEEIERLVELNIQEDHLKIKFKERILEIAVEVVVLYSRCRARIRGPSFGRVSCGKTYVQWHLREWIDKTV